MKKIICLILVVLMLFTICACGAKKEDASDKKTFIMGIDVEYPPFSYIDDNGDITGFDVEVCQAVCEKLGWEFKYYSVNWDQKLVQLDSKECDCVWCALTILDSMKEAGYVLSKPYFDSTQVFVVKTDSGFTTSADMVGKDVAVQLGTSGQALISEGGALEEMGSSFNNIIACDSALKAFTELGGGAVDAFFVDKPVAEGYVADHEGFSIINENLGSEQYGIVYRSGDQELCDAIDGAVDELVKDGTYAKIADKYPELKSNLLFLG